MAEFVLNEWLWADFSGENGSDRRKEATCFLQAFIASPHRAVVVAGSKFDAKAFRACGSSDVVTRLLAAQFKDRVRMDSLKCRLLLPHELSDVPVELARETNSDDHYLIRGQMAVAGSVVVTTDNALLGALVAAGVPCRYRDEVVREFLQGA